MDFKEVILQYVDYKVILDNLPMYFDGLVLTVQLVFISLVIGLLIAVPLAVLRLSKNRWVAWPVWFYTYFFRGTPLLVQLFLIYYGMGQFIDLNASSVGAFFKDAYYCALVAFTLNTAAYTTEIIRGAMKETPRGEIEAAKAYGMSYLQTFYRIILPSAFRRALPAYSNEVVFMLHGSAIAGVVTIMDITGVARVVYSRFYTPFEAFIFAGLLYMMLTFMIVWGFRQLEHRWLAHLRPRS